MGNAVALYRALGFQDIPAYCFNPVPGALFLELQLPSNEGKARAEEES
jgi:hypothetical protein